MEIQNTKHTKWHVILLCLFILLGFPLIVWWGAQRFVEIDDTYIDCGGLLGSHCPTGYFCKYPVPNPTDGPGRCGRIDQSKLAACLKTKNVTIICSTKYQCAKQKELLGDMFQYLKVKYDDSLADCAKYGRNNCDTNYQDNEMINWIIQNSPYPPSNQSGTLFLGTRDMSGLAWMTNCPIE